MSPNCEYFSDIPKKGKYCYSEPNNFEECCRKCGKCSRCPEGVSYVEGAPAFGCGGKRDTNAEFCTNPLNITDLMLPGDFVTDPMSGCKYTCNDMGEVDEKCNDMSSEITLTESTETTSTSTAGSTSATSEATATETIVTEPSEASQPMTTPYGYTSPEATGVIEMTSNTEAKERLVNNDKERDINGASGDPTSGKLFHAASLIYVYRVAR